MLAPEGALDRYLVKGTHVLMARKWIDERLGEGAFVKLIRAQPLGWPPVLLPASWYDVDPMNHALHAAAEKLASTVEQVATEIARANAVNDLKTVYRAFLRVAGPHLVMNATASLWRNYVNFGLAKKITNDKGHYIGECSGIPQRLLDWACGAWLGFVPAAIELAGGKSCVARILERHADNPELSTLRCEVRYQ